MQEEAIEQSFKKQKLEIDNKTAVDWVRISILKQFA